MNSRYLIGITILILHLTTVHSKHIQKRQIYREQVLPNRGGKIPDSAFKTDRLALNRLQKEGIAVPDGIILEQRNPQVYQYSHRTNRPVYNVALTANKIYTSHAGMYHHPKAPSIETTYPIPRNNPANQILSHNIPARPLYNTLTIPNYSLLKSPQFQHHEQINDNHEFRTSHQNEPSHVIPSTHYIASYESSSYAAAAVTNYPYKWNHYYHNDLISSTIFHDFESFFNSFAQGNHQIIR